MKEIVSKEVGGVHSRFILQIPYVYTHKCACMYVHGCVHTHTNTHTHTQKRKKLLTIGNITKVQSRDIKMERRPNDTSSESQNTNGEVGMTPAGQGNAQNPGENTHE